MEAATATHKWALVLAGGDGTRLQELTRIITGKPIPKQYCRIVGDRSLLEATLARTVQFAPEERTLVIVNRDHLPIAQEQLRCLPPHSVLVQPRNCDTGPGLLLSLLHLSRRTPEATIAVFPSDHFVGDDRVFMMHVERAARVVGQYPEKIVLLGIRPDRSDVGYGYLEPAHPLGSVPGIDSAFHVAAFCEKPGAALARQLLSRGGLWNSFVMVFQLERMLALIEQVMPEQYALMAALPDDPERAAHSYRRVTPWNFSSGFLARIPEHQIVLRVDDTQWSDWGTREAIERTLAHLKQKPPWRMRRRVAVAA